MFEEYQPICSVSMYVSLTVFFERGFVRSTLLIGRSPFSTFGYQTKISVLLFISDKVFQIDVTASNNFTSIDPNLVTCCTEMGTDSFKYVVNTILF